MDIINPLMPEIQKLKKIFYTFADDANTPDFDTCKHDDQQ